MLRNSWLIPCPSLRMGLLAGMLCAAAIAFSQTSAPPPTQQPVPAAQQSSGTPQAPTAAPAVQRPVADLKVVSAANDHLQVEVLESSNLSKVFKAICAEQKLDCTGADTLAGYPVPKMQVDGTLREVVDNLLEGTNINYRYTRATGAIKAKLVLLGHAPQGNNAALPPRGSTENVPPTPLHSMPFPGRVPPPPPGNSGATEPSQTQPPPQQQ